MEKIRDGFSSGDRARESQEKGPGKRKLTHVDKTACVLSELRGAGGQEGAGCVDNPV